MNALIEPTLAEIMNCSVRHVLPECSLIDAARQMNEAHISSMLVMSGNTPLGILTERDLLRLLSTHADSNTPVSEIMSAPVLTVSPELGFNAAYEQVLHHHVRHLVVVDAAGLVIGLVSETDFRNHLGAGVLSRLDNLDAVMDQKLPLLSTDATLEQAVAMMLREGSSYALVVENGLPVGILTERDMAGLLVAGKPTAEVALCDVMHAPVLTVSQQMPVYEMAGLMQAKQLRHLVVVNDDGQVLGMVTLHRLMERIAISEMSEQSLRANLAKIQDLNRLYSALSQCNQAIVRSACEAELFENVCRIAVQFGGMKMAWIGMLDGFSRQIVPVAFDGEGVEYLQGKVIFADENTPYGRGPTGTALRENMPYWCQDFQHDPATLPWHETGMQFGWRASASLPLHCNNLVVGAFTLYSSEANAFDDATRNLLIEMAADISFGLGRFADKAEQAKTHAKLATQVRRAEALLSLPQAADTMDERCFMQYCVEITERLTNSKIAFIHWVNDDQETIELVTWSSATLLEYCHATHDKHYPISQAGIWADAFRQKKPVVYNDYAAAPNKHGLPDGHAHLERLISVPVIENGQVRMMAGVGNKASDYTDLDVESVQLVANFLWNSVQQRRAEMNAHKLTQAVEKSPNTIVITDLAANIEYANAAFTTVTGYSLSEVIGKNPRILHSGKTPQSTYDAMWKQLTAGEIWRGELTNHRKDGTEYIESVMISPLRRAGGQVTNYLAIKEDITEKKQAEARILQLAHFDLLTGLPNQALLKERVALSMQIAQRNATQLAVLFLDIDHFKNINDTLGHRVGDELLIQLAARLKVMVRDEDTLSRMGGDEFVLVLPGTDADGAANVAEKILATVAQTYHIEQHELVVTPSIGIAMYPGDGLDFDKLYQCADAAMYRAKQGGRNNFCFFTREMQDRSARRLQLENALRRALELNQLQLYYQPQISMQDGHVIGAEALLRWNHPELGAISPVEFIPVAEESGLILSIGEWVLRTAAKQAKCWMDGGMPAITIAVNLSAVQFRQENLAELVMQILDEVSLLPEYIELELTESVAMDNPLAAIAVMNELHARGIHMSIDDFGTGYSSLSYLRKFKVGKLKIDQSFVRDLTDDTESRAIITAIITLATSMGFQTIAEGVETADQLSFLRLQGCNEVQGYYFSKPLPVAQFEEFIGKQKKIRN